MVKTIATTKHLNSQTKHPKVFYVMISKMGSHMKKKTLYLKLHLVYFQLILLTYQLSSNQKQ